MLYQKAYFFKNSTKAKETLLTRIIKKSRKATRFVKSVTIDYVKSRVVRTQMRIRRGRTICWAIERNNTQYFNSGRLKHYSAGDIHRMVNACLVKDGLKPASSRTLRGDIKVLKDLGLIKAVIQPLGEGNGSFAFYVINWKLWRNYKTIIKNYFEQKLINDFADKRIKGSFEEKIDSIVFNDAVEIESEETQAVSKEIQDVGNKTETLCTPLKKPFIKTEQVVGNKTETSGEPSKTIEQYEDDILSNASPQNAAPIPKGIVSFNNNKNSKKTILKKYNKEPSSNKVGAAFGCIGIYKKSSYEKKDRKDIRKTIDEKKVELISKSVGKIYLKASSFKNNDNRQDRLPLQAPPRCPAPPARKEAYKRSYEEHMECKLEKKYRINKHTLARIRLASNNVATHRNALRNLESSLIYARDYSTEDVAEYYTQQFTQVYSHKVWMLNPNTDKANDFYKIWGTFMDKYANKYKQQELLSSRVYSDGYGNLCETDSSGRFKDSGARPLSVFLDKFRQGININKEVVS
ncbi:plasmid maintenance protein [Borrelia sp. P9F1]|uniref:plasmid maintenance protein n=1 Tax=Borrelia sp. P9F1 TaxID=3058374 RepID=UPI002647B789|nr:plasmid maintenance protein [Borrelia sp. P9F1]WKC58531.1 plasmid maintenance protein [Borrelia sp. P9F1]